MEPWRFDPKLDLAQPFCERLRQFPRQPDMLVFSMRWLAATLLRGWLRMYHRLSVIGRENLPVDRSFVMVANHASHLDTLCLLSALPLAKLDHAFPTAAQDYFFVNRLRTFLAAVVANALPFDRRLDPRHSLEVCAHVLDNPGNVLIVFPEGTRSDNGVTHDFKAGIGLLVAGRNIPVVPCYLDGAFAAWPKGARLPRPRSVRLTIGAPRFYAHLPATKEAAKQVGRDLRQAVLTLADALPERRVLDRLSPYPEVPCNIMS